MFYYYLVELADPSKKLRHYRNSRVAEYTVDEMNKAAGFERYAYVKSDVLVNVDYVGENPLEDKVQFMDDEANK